MADAEKKLKVGIVSANWGAIAHLPAWRLVPGVEVTAICTSRQESAEQAAQQFGVERPFWSYEAMAADPDIDIIDAGTNPALREKIVTAALNGGKHAVNQLPFAMSHASAQAMEDLRREKGLFGAAAASVVGLPHLALMKQMIEAGEIGEIYQVHCNWELSFHLQISPGYPYVWFGKGGQGVSVLRNQGSHLLHALRHVFGPIDSLVGSAQIRHKVWTLPDGEKMEAETDDTAHALLRFRSGAMGTFVTSWTAADSPGFALEVLGSKGRLKLTGRRYPSVQTASLYFSSKNDPMLEPAGAEVPVPDELMSIGGQLVGPDPMDLYNGGQRISLARVFGSLTDAIRGQGNPLPSFARAAEVQGLVEALYESDRRKAWVDTAALAKD